MKSTHRALGLLTAAALTCASLAACSGTGDAPEPGSSPDAKTVLKVVALLPGSTQEAVDAFNAQVAEFEAANPDIDVQPEEYEWKATTFAAQLAGGTLPDVFEIPFTDAQGLVENAQLADMDEQFRSLPYAGKFNEAILEAGTGKDGKVYAIPAKNAYPIALTYNRTLFASAGLDPDLPPTTWDEVRTSSIDNPATRATLEFFKTLRWEDASMGENFLLDWGSINQAFAAGEVAMFTSGSDIYTSLVQTNAVDPDTYGLAPIPLTGDDPAVLTGGTLAGVPATASDQVKDAAIKWIDFFYLSKLVDQDRAVEDAKTLVANDQPVGTPVLPMFSQEQYELNMEWIKDYVNVPLAQMKPFTDQMFSLPLAGEPSQRTQDIYALLDPAVQAVLTDQNADIGALLKAADEQAQALLDQG